MYEGNFDVKFERAALQLNFDVTLRVLLWGKSLMLPCEKSAM
jgi:hypothetical protein